MSSDLRKYLQQFDELIKKYNASSLHENKKNEKISYLESIKARLDEEINGVEKYEKNTVFRQSMEKSIEERYDREYKNADEYIENIINPPEDNEDNPLLGENIYEIPELADISVIPHGVYYEQGATYEAVRPKGYEYSALATTIDRAINTKKYEQDFNYLESIINAIVNYGSVEEKQIADGIFARINNLWSIDKSFVADKNLLDFFLYLENDEYKKYQQKLVDLIPDNNDDAKYSIPQQRMIELILLCWRGNKSGVHCPNLLNKVLINSSKRDIILNFLDQKISTVTNPIFYTRYYSANENIKQALDSVINDPNNVHQYIYQALNKTEIVHTYIENNEEKVDIPAFIKLDKNTNFNIHSFIKVDPASFIYVYPKIVNAIIDDAEVLKKILNKIIDENYQQAFSRILFNLSKNENESKKIIEFIVNNKDNKLVSKIFSEADKEKATAATFIQLDKENILNYRFFIKNNNENKYVYPNIVNAIIDNGKVLGETLNQIQSKEDWRNQFLSNLAKNEPILLKFMDVLKNTATEFDTAKKEILDILVVSIKIPRTNLNIIKILQKYNEIYNDIDNPILKYIDDKENLDSVLNSINTNYSFSGINLIRQSLYLFNEKKENLLFRNVANAIVAKEELLKKVVTNIYKENNQENIKNLEIVDKEFFDGKIAKIRSPRVVGGYDEYSPMIDYPDNTYGGLIGLGGALFYRSSFVRVIALIVIIVVLLMVLLYLLQDNQEFFSQPKRTAKHKTVDYKFPSFENKKVNEMTTF